MINKYLVVSVFLVACMLVGGCDMFRSIAGRPTSKELEAMRMELVSRKARESAMKDSLEKVDKARRDSVAAASARDSLEAMKGYLRPVSRFAGLAQGSAFTSKYALIMGSFKDSANAERFAARIQSEGYPAVTIAFRNGFTAVGACPSDRPDELLSSIQKIRQEDFCPKDVWILVNE